MSATSSRRSSPTGDSCAGDGRRARALKRKSLTNRAQGAWRQPTTRPPGGPIEEACATLAKGNVDGIGYVVTQRDGFAALDLDHCRDPKSGDLEPWAGELIARADSYTEITPSGEGVRILGIANGVPDAHYQLPRGINGQTRRSLPQGHALHHPV